MIVFPSMIVKAAEDAGMKVPENPDGGFDAEEFPHFNVFCITQLERPVAYHGEHWENAKIIAKIPEDKIREVSLVDLLRMGLSFRS